MKQLVILIAWMAVSFPSLAWGINETVILDIQAGEKGVQFKNELRIGNWESGKDGYDPLDLEAMTNGQFDAYLVIPKEDSLSLRALWRDIRSASPSEEWKLIIKSATPRKVGIDWRRIASYPVNPIVYTILDSDSGELAVLDQESGRLELTVSGTKTLVIRSRPR